MMIDGGEMRKNARGKTGIDFYSCSSPSIETGPHPVPSTTLRAHLMANVDAFKNFLLAYFLTRY